MSGDEDRIAFAGMVDAHRRYHEHVHFCRGQLAHAAVVDCLRWICALDEQLWPGAGYQPRRDQDPDGCVVRGLRHARDRHTHHLVISADINPIPFWGGAGGDGNLHISATPHWLRADAIGDSPEKVNHPQYKANRAAYVAHIERKWVQIPLARAMVWLSAEYRAAGLTDFEETLSPAPDRE